MFFRGCVDVSVVFEWERVASELTVAMSVLHYLQVQYGHPLMHFVDFAVVDDGYVCALIKQTSKFLNGDHCHDFGHCVFILSLLSYPW